MTKDAIIILLASLLGYAVYVIYVLAGTSVAPCAAPTTTRYALSFCNSYGDTVGDTIYTCYPLSINL